MLGTLILLFLILHLYHFWTPSRFGGIAAIHELKETTLSEYNDQRVHDLYAEMKIVFQYPGAMIVYVLGVIALAWHLMHGFQSVFQTFGIVSKKYRSFINGLGAFYTIVICSLFALMPIAIYLKWIN